MVKRLDNVENRQGAKAESGSADEHSSSGRLPLRHVAIIMDGNRRWAKDKGFPRLMGHKEGVKSLKRLVRHVGALGLDFLTVYAFSSENWQRTQEEVNYLFELFGSVLRDEFDELAENRVRLSFLGDLTAVPPKLRASMMKSMESSADNKGLSLQVAINYGARLEITNAVQQIARAVKEGKLEVEQITEELVSSQLYTSAMPDPELLIRTGGELRLSNYLLWQCAYTELYITPVLWPDFTPEDFDQAINEFTRRQRRYGGD